ncbi:aminotransferase A [Bacillus suaedaesalsae]|uniref:Aminotransferase n=1 Tax=Bacillus suaedaesalsae TaxID=2810349 RepID=A0ABS2DGD6_9BACI|nr:aminotransferase A [Bacillus suaedaesalsae]
MEHLINNTIKSIQISGIRRFFNMVQEYDNVLSLTIGQPDFPTPQHVKDAGIEGINHNYTTYTHNAGYLELRIAAAKFVKEKYGLEYNPENEVITTIGASQAIDCAFRTILEKNSEVILPGPVYPGYEPIIHMCGAKPIHVDTRHNGFKLTANLIEQHLTEDTRCIVLPYPSNPTGVTLSIEELEEIANLLKDRDIFVLSDEIYSELIFEGSHHSIATIAGMREKTIVINGLSKSHSMTGWRIGFLFAPHTIAKHLLKVHQYNVSCAPTISQRAAIEALSNGQDDAIVMRDTYKDRMEYVYQRLTNMGIDTVKPTGAFYFFPSIKKFGMSSFDFALSLVKEAGVALVPGDAFSDLGEGYVRLSYAYSKETLKEALDRMEYFIKKRQC